VNDLDVTKFCRLFVGRMDAYGTEEGGCDRTPQWAWPGYYGRIGAHLDGSTPTGVYPMVLDSEIGWAVRWGCVDFDLGDEASWVHACNLHDTLGAFGIRSHRERSRSKGFHVWVFADSWVPAPTMRRALIGASTIAGSPISEVNPKSEGYFTKDEDGTLTPNASVLGNYVRLPYPGGWDETQRRVIVDDYQRTISAEDFVADAYENRLAITDLDPLVALWEPPKKIAFTASFDDEFADNVDTENLPKTDLMCKTSYAAWRFGPYEGNDRSSTLWKLTNSLAKDGYKPAEVLAFVIDGDRRWGKFVARDDIGTLERMVAKVFT
jgi:hypothetical protein